MREAHNTDVEYAFYNDRVKEIIADAEIQEPFTYVPIKAGHMELVGGNALVFGKITEGYDIINPSVVVVPTYEDISTRNPRQNLTVDFLLISEDIAYLTPTWFDTVSYYENYVVQVDSGYGYPLFFRSKYDDNKGHDPLGPGGSLWWTEYPAWATESVRDVDAQIVITIPTTVIVGAYYYITVRNDLKGLDFTAEYEALVGDTYLNVIAGLTAQLLANGVDAGDIEVGPDDNKMYLFQSSKTFLNTPTYEATELRKVFENFNPMVNAFILLVGHVLLLPQLKVGSTHGFGLVYKDRGGRTCSVMKTSDLNVYIPFYAEETTNDLATIVNLVFQLYHKPPAWAETYEIVYYGNLSMSDFLQVRINNITSLGANRFAVNVKQTIYDIWNRNNRWRVDDMVWQGGDRMRLLGTINEDTGEVTKYNDLYDYEIEETGTQHGEEINGDWLIIQAVNCPDNFGNETTITTAVGTLSGTVNPTQPFEEGAVRVDTITLAGGGAGDTAAVYCGGLERELTYNASLNQTATDFVTTWAADYLAIGIIVTAPGGGTLVFTMDTDSIDFPSETNILVEIYRPRKGLERPSGQGVAYGTGMVFEIAVDENGNRYHKGDTDQVFNAAGECTTRAEIENTANDCWKFMRLNYRYGTDEVQPFFAESYYPSDWWDNLTASSRLTSMGFPFLDDLSQRQTVLNERLRHGGFLITGTRTNNIAHFTYEDFLDLPKKNGQITGLREVGYTLKVLQLTKETSIYVNRIVNFNADGTEEFTLTNKFLGTVYPMNDDYGCQNPHGIMVNGRNLYYWDNNEGALIRSAPNGQIVISGAEYKMSRWFKELVKWIQDEGGKDKLQVNIGANNEHGEVWVTFNMNGEIKGVIFSEKGGRYVSRLNQVTESYLHLGNFFAHIYQQRLWIMNIDEGQDWLSWSGTPTYAIIETISNIDHVKNKVFTSVALFSDHELECLERYIKIPEEASGVNLLMETNIPRWDRREGVFFGEIMKDINSKGSFSGLYDRKLNGNEMRGRHCFVKFFTEEHDEKVRIDSVVIFSTPSERNV